jgi:hypothetical protein
MASNAYTQQPPKAGNSTKVVLAERAFVATYPTAYADPAAKLNGSLTPAAGWQDLGIVMGSQVQLTYNKEVKFIETGIEKIRRGSYVVSKTAQAQFTLEQYDMGVMELVSGISKVAVTGGNKLYVGQDDIVEKSLLFVGSNKADPKEFHTYCKQANLTWAVEQNDDARVIRVTADLFAFDPGNGIDAYYVLYILN